MSGREEYRAAAVAFLKDYATYADVELQVYPGRPRSIFPPCGFVDRFTTQYTPFTEHHFQQTPQVVVTILHGLFDSADAVAQADRFVDGFVAWAYANAHAAGANSLIWASNVEDVPDYVPEWLPSEQQRTYYATQITLEGFATN